MLERRRWPHLLYYAGWTLGIGSCAAAIYIGIQPVVLSMALKLIGIGLAVFGLNAVGILIMSGLDRPWPKMRYSSVWASERGLVFVRQPTKAKGEDLLEWSDIEQVEVERRALYTEVRIVGAGSRRGKSLKLNSLSWAGLDDLVKEVMARSQARLVEGRRDRLGGDYS